MQKGSNSLTRNERIIASIVFLGKSSIYHSFFASVRKMSEYFPQCTSENLSDRMNENHPGAIQVLWQAFQAKAASKARVDPQAIKMHSGMGWPRSRKDRTPAFWLP